MIRYQCYEPWRCDEFYKHQGGAKRKSICVMERYNDALPVPTFLYCEIVKSIVEMRPRQSFRQEIFDILEIT